MCKAVQSYRPASGQAAAAVSGNGSAIDLLQLVDTSLTDLVTSGKAHAAVAHPVTRGIETGIDIGFEPRGVWSANPFFSVTRDGIRVSS
jgi:hypothetical protein